MRKLLMLLAILGLPTIALAQVPSTYTPQLITYQGVPFGVCAVYQIAENVTNGNYYTCNISTSSWQAVGSGFNGSIATNQIAFGSASNTLAGSANFTFTNSTGFMQLIGGTGGGSFLGLPSIVEFRVPNGATENIAFTNASAPAGTATEIQMGNDGAFSLFASTDGVTFSAIDIPANGDIQLGAGPTNVLTVLHTSGVTLAPGLLTLKGSSSGSASIGVAAVAFSPNEILLPGTTGSQGQFLQTNGSNPQQTSWATIVMQCGTVAANGNCANTVTGSEHCISGQATLSGGTSTVSGISPAFSSANSFTVVTNDTTTITNASKGVPASGSSIVFTGTGTDVLNFVACGG